MGHCYSREGGLICDCCNTPAKGTRTRACPFKWCNADLCASCLKASRWASQANHADCRRYSEAMRNREKEEADALAAGAWVRFSALTTAPGVVRVSFKNQAGERLELAVTQSSYCAVPPLDVATPESFTTIPKEG